MFHRLKKLFQITASDTVLTPLSSPSAGPGPIQNWLTLGKQALEQEKLAQAVEYLERALESDPLVVEPYPHLCMALFKQGHTDEARKVIERGIALHPEAAVFHFFRGNLLLHANQRDEAISSYQTALSLDPNSSAVHFNLGVTYLQQGKPEQAEASLQRTLMLSPKLATAHKLLGDVLKSQRRDEEAITCYRSAISCDLGYIDAHYCLATTLHNLGKLDAALTSYQNVVSLDPRHADAHNNIGAVLQNQGKLDAAGESFRQALSIQPDAVDTHCNLGLLLKLQGKLEDAIACYQKALSINPDYPNAYLGSGSILQKQLRTDEALACFRKAMSLNPGAVEANNLGLFFLEQSDHSEAMSWFRKALTIKSDYSDAYCNIGMIHLIRGDLDSASTCFSTVLKHQPDHAVACNHFGNILRMRGDLDAAHDYFRRALSIAPRFADAYNSLGGLFDQRGDMEAALNAYQQALVYEQDLFAIHMNMGNVLRKMGQPDRALASFRRAAELAPKSHSAQINLLHHLKHFAEWSDFDTITCAALQTAQKTPSALTDPFFPFAFQALTGTSLSEQKHYAEEFARSTFGGLIPLRNELAFNKNNTCSQKIRVGYISADFRDHPVSLLMAKVFEEHDRSRFHFTAYSLSPDDNSVISKRVRNAFDSFVSLHGQSNPDAAEKIHADQIDVLVDLMGYTMGNRAEILALKPAPIQVNYLGYPGTMGAEFMDYLIADPFIIPPELQDGYTERVMRLPHSYLPRDQTNPRRASPERETLGLPRHGFVFCCFNQTYKITPQIFDIWCQLLRAVPNSVFWLSMGHPVAQKNLRQEASRRGIDPARFIDALKVPQHADHLARLQCADLFLDTAPYNAHTTCSDALWMGLPVLTCVGETFPSRVGGSLLSAIGVPELITYKLDDYHALALELATDKEKLHSIRHKVMMNRDTAALFDSIKFARDLEAIYTTMWNDYRQSSA